MENGEGRLKKVNWVPLAIVALMAGAAVEALIHHNCRFGVFWLLDAAITGWSSYMLVVKPS